MENNGDNEITQALIEVLGEISLIDDYNVYKRKVSKYSHEEMYWDMFRDIIAQLEVKLVVAKMDTKEKLSNLSRKRLKNNFVSLDLIPTKGNDKVIFESFIKKLRCLKILKSYFNL